MSKCCCESEYFIQINRTKKKNLDNGFVSHKLEVMESGDCKKSKVS